MSHILSDITISTLIESNNITGWICKAKSRDGSIYEGCKNLVRNVRKKIFVEKTEEKHVLSVTKWLTSRCLDRIEDITDTSLNFVKYLVINNRISRPDVEAVIDVRTSGVTHRLISIVNQCFCRYIYRWPIVKGAVDLLCVVEILTKQRLLFSGLKLYSDSGQATSLSGDPWSCMEAEQMYHLFIIRFTIYVIRRLYVAGKWLFHQLFLFSCLTL